MSDKRWGVAVLGCGSIGEMHVRAFRELPSARVVGVSSRRVARAREVAASVGCAFTDDPHALIADPAVDLVAITTSSGSHAGLALAALEAGKHVVIEKPMAMTSADAARIVEQARDAGLVVSVISQRRFEAQHQAIRRLVDEGALGRLLLLEAACPYFRTQEYYDSADWRGTTTADGGALMNQAIHSVDLLLWLGGPAQSVFARTATQTHEMEAEDLALALVTFENGAYGSLMASTSVRPGFPPTLALYGTEGTIKLEGATILHWTVPGVPPPQATDGASAGVSSPRLASHEHHKTQLAELLDALAQGRSPAVTAEDGLRAVALVEAAYRSAERGLPVTLAALPAPPPKW